MIISSLIFPLILSSQTVDFVAFDPVISSEVEGVVRRRADMPHDQFLRELEELGIAGDLSAWELLGEMHSLGVLGQTVDKKVACDYFEKVEPVRADTMHNVATCYFEGKGRSQDFAKARAWYSRAAEAGYLQSYCAHGNMLVRGQGGVPDSEAGLALCKFAAERGDKNAQTDLGTYLLTGEFTERDPVLARDWLTKAGNQEQANASFLLGQIYARGDGINSDPKQSRDWLERAYRLGRQDAPYQLLASYVKEGMKKQDGKWYIETGFRPFILKWARVAEQTDYDPKKREDAAAIIIMIENSESE